MIRRAAAVLLALTLYPASLHAQDTVLTVTVQSADVYKGPSTATPVIGHAARGTALAVSRNLGSWVQVPWPDSPDGIAYVHVTMGRLGARGANPPASGARATSAPAAPASSTRSRHGADDQRAAYPRLERRSSSAERPARQLKDQPRRWPWWDGWIDEHLWRDRALVA